MLWAISLSSDINCSLVMVYFREVICFLSFLGILFLSLYPLSFKVPAKALKGIAAFSQAVARFWKAFFSICPSSPIFVIVFMVVNLALLRKNRNVHFEIGEHILIQ